MMKLADRLGSLSLTAAVAFGLPMNMAFAQQSPSTAVAFVNVNLISMDGARVEPKQSVVVHGDRIARIGPSEAVAVPEGATVIDGAGRYLVPGLTDAHVHLTTDMPWAPARPDFGDAPLYLAYGVTSVLNLGGNRTQLEWRRRIEAGELAGPTIYTAGAFVNEPRVNTPEEVQREIVAQAREGYDVIKFHEVWEPGRGYLTTTGLSLGSYMRMVETAREVGIPLVGHAPVNLGMGALFRARQPLAHMGTLSNIYFMPMASNQGALLTTAGTSLALIIIVATWAAAAIVGWARGAVRHVPRMLSRIRTFTRWVSLWGLLALICATLLLPGGLLFDSLLLRLFLTGLSLLVAAATIALVVFTVRLWRDRSASGLARLQSSVLSIASIGLTSVLLIFWVPVAWRSSDRGIERLASRLHDAGISVQTTLVLYESLNAAARSSLVQDPALDYLLARTKAQWRRQQLPPALELVAGRYREFMNNVAGALHRAGVTLVAGTDAMGAPPVAPGSSLHRELQLLIEAGLTPYEAIRTATVNPASFLGKANEFGTIAVGKRADLLLIEGNPLEDITRLKQPIGVMARGHWLSRERLQEMLAALRNH